MIYNHDLQTSDMLGTKSDSNREFTKNQGLFCVKMLPLLPAVNCKAHVQELKRTISYPEPSQTYRTADCTNGVLR